MIFQQNHTCAFCLLFTLHRLPHNHCQRDDILSLPLPPPLSPPPPLPPPRLVEKARERQQSVDKSSESVCARVFELQGRLRRSFLDQISKASMHERDNLRQWRRVIQLNTHPRYACACVCMHLCACKILRNMHMHLYFPSIILHNTS